MEETIRREKRGVKASFCVLRKEGKTMFELSIKCIFVAISTVLTYLFGGWDLLIQFLIVVQFLDFFTGVAAGGVNGQLSSKIGREGIRRKCFVWAFVIIGHLADVLLTKETLEFFDLSVHFPIRTLIITYYLSNEVLSIIENGDRIGLPTPKFLKRLFENVKEKTDDIDLHDK